VGRQVALHLDHLDALGAQRVEQAAMLLGDKVEVGRVAILPVPEAVRVDEGAGIVAPGILANQAELASWAADEDGAQAADLIAGAPAAPPEALLLPGIGERRAVVAAEQGEVIAGGIGAADPASLHIPRYAVALVPYTVAHVDDIEPAGPGNIVRFVRRELGVEAFGVNRFDLPPNSAGVEHTELKTGHEEVCAVISGSGHWTIDGEDVAVPQCWFMCLGTGAALAVGTEPRLGGGCR
jgi:hypothetical protein